MAIDSTPTTHRRIVLAVGGGIAAYKTATVASRLVQHGAEVRPVMTAAATEFLGTSTLAALCGRPVAQRIFQPETYPLGAHIHLAEDADLMVVAPATADLLHGFALGAADSLLTTLFLQVQCPVLLAPAMSTAMWTKPAVQRNVERLRADGVRFVGPASGWLSCRQSGEGRMAEPEAILAAIEATLTEADR
jgi:phosphopantothenoylcysteine decarboxylase/phosphopantothenate--cysteine ligase